MDPWPTLPALINVKGTPGTSILPCEHMARRWSCESLREVILLELDLGLFSIQNCEKQMWYLATHLMDFYCGSLSRVKVKRVICWCWKLFSRENTCFASRRSCISCPNTYGKAHVCISSGEEDTDNSPGVHWLTSLVMVRSKFREQLCLKKQGGERLRKRPDISPWPPHIHAYMCMWLNPYRYVHMHT